MRTIAARSNGAARCTALAATLCCGMVLSSCTMRAGPQSGIESLDCGGVQIQVVENKYRTALDIKYSVAAGGAGFCVPDSRYDHRSPEAIAIVLIPADDNFSQGTMLSQPLRFERASGLDARVNALGSPYYLDVATGGPIVYDVPPGEYRLLLRYRKGKCGGAMFSAVCTTESEVFIVEESQEFVVERSAACVPLTK